MMARLRRHLWTPNRLRLIVHLSRRLLARHHLYLTPAMRPRPNGRRGSGRAKTSWSAHV
jgi:hypothetical protein